MGSFYMESTQINYRRDETVKTVDQKLQELSETSAIDTDIAPVFKSTNTYAPGDMVYYRNKLYVFNVEHTGAWAAADVTATDVTTELSSLKSGLTNVDVALSVPENAGKNMIPLSVSGIKAANTTGTWVDNTYNINGIDYTINTDASDNVIGIGAVGTSSADAGLILLFKQPLSGNYILNGCPSGGGNNTYFEQIYQNNAWGARDAGNGVSISGSNIQAVSLTVKSGNTVDITYLPMVRLSIITDPTFAPYIPSVESRIEAVESGLSSLGASANLSNWNDYSDFNGKYIIIGKLCIFNLTVIKADSSWNLAGIPNQQAAIDNTAVAYDAVNQKRIFAKNTTGAIVLQLQATDIYTNATNVSGCIVLA